MNIEQKDWEAMIDRMHTFLGISEDYASSRSLTLFPEAQLVELVLIDYQGKTLRLEPEAARAWRDLSQAASDDGTQLLPFSGFRSYKYQLDLFKQRLALGDDLETILAKLAAPGYSEHHTGRAVDITSEGYKPTTQEFEESDAFAWLAQRASEFGFVMSYPEDNPHGFIYEPWHWAYCP